MYKVIVTKWNEGFNKIALNKSLREHCNLGLAEAHSFVESLLDGKRLELKFDDSEGADDFYNSVIEIGAEAHIMISN